MRREALQNQSLAYGAIAQLGERFHGMEEVVGSIPTSSTNTRSIGTADYPQFSVRRLFSWAPLLSDGVRVVREVLDQLGGHFASITDPVDPPERRQQAREIANFPSIVGGR